MEYLNVKPCLGKSSENIHKSNLKVDKWEIEHKDDIKSGKEIFFENYVGQVPIESTEEQKYLGFVLSSKGSNMANINYMRNKSYEIIIKTIFRNLESLNLKHYYFECAIILMNAMLRSGIYYASETYYDLKENERELRRIF